MTWFGHHRRGLRAVPEWNMTRFGPHRRGRLHWRIFVWFGVSILLAGTVVLGVLRLLAFPTWHAEVEHGMSFAAARFAAVWDRPAERAEFARSLSGELGMGVLLEDEHHTTLASYGPRCLHGRNTVPVRRGDRVVGYLGLCWSRTHHPRVLVAILVAAGLTLWAASGALARHLVRPLYDLARVAREIGSGRLAARTRLGRQRSDEIGALAEAIYEMAARIERQLCDQRELLATVSHELRTPLGHLRILVELLREQGPSDELFAGMEREIHEMDVLMGELLASSRLDFAALTLHSLRARDAALRALERAGLDPSVLADESDGASFAGDATLIGRALGNLLDNAALHGRGVVALGVRRRQDTVEFEVDDRGPGFLPEDLERAFNPFYRGSTEGQSTRASLGLGLALVRRIAHAHGGRAWAKNRPEGGARVGFCVSVSPTREEPSRSPEATAGTVA
jgi:signal transduction histidine kinase